MKLNFLLLLVFLSFNTVSLLAQIRITELMQSNVDCIMDDTNDFPDSWVELYNSGEWDVDLGNYKIGKSEIVSKAYQLPSRIIHPNEFALVYCDKKDSGLHTDFRLESGKGGVYLFKNDKIEDSISFPKQPSPNIAFGRVSIPGETNAEWGYMSIPTPYKENMNSISKGVLPQPIFSHDALLVGGAASVNLELSLEIPSEAPDGSYIRYTLDGSEPTSVSSLYEGPIMIKGGCVVKAKLFSEGYVSQRSVAKSFLTHQLYITLPTISLSMNPEFLYSDSVGIYSNNVYSNDSVNYRYDWRRPVNLEVFNEKGEAVINQLCETRIHGGGSRQYPLKSMVLYANKRFGIKQFDYEFFPTQKPCLDKFDSFILRNSGSDFVYLYMRDVIIQGTMSKHVDLDWQAYQPAVVFINGEYKGLMYIRERSTDDYVISNYDIEDFDMIENWRDLKSGDWNNFNDFVKFYSEKGHSIVEYKEWMDIDEYRDYMIMELFFANRDFPGNNIVMWRPKTDGGKWRWIAKDLDFGLGLETGYGFNIFPWFYADETAPNEPFRRLPGEDTTILFKNLMENEVFKSDFIERSTIYMGDFLNSKGVHDVWDSIRNVVKDEYLLHRKKYGNWGWIWRDYEVVQVGVDEWIKSRPDYYIKHLSDFYKYGDYSKLVIEKAHCLEFNGFKMSSENYDGYFWDGKQINLKSKNSFDNPIVGWNVKSILDGVNNETIYDGSELTIIMPKCDSVVIEPLFSTTGVVAQKQSTPSAYVRNGYIYLSGSKGMSYTIYSMDGILIKQGIKKNDDQECLLKIHNSTIYILVSGGTALKLGYSN